MINIQNTHVNETKIRLKLIQGLGIVVHSQSFKIAQSNRVI